MDRHTFMFELQTKGLTGDWFPFKQGDYIQDKLHGGHNSPSRLREGVCHALCLHVMKDWMQNGISVDAIGRLDRTATQEYIVDRTDAGSTVQDFKDDMAGAGHPMSAENYHLSHKSAIEHTCSTGFSLFATGALTGGDGHAIICNGKEGTIFDPNVGYIKASSTSNYTWCFLSIFSKFYPEFLTGNRAVRTYAFT